VIAGEDFNSRLTMQERLQEVPLLVVDELIYMEGDKRIDHVDTLLRRRVDNRVPTIITSNHTPRALLKYMPSMMEGIRESIIQVPFFDSSKNSINWREK